jgi:hypothetical protein
VGAGALAPNPKPPIPNPQSPIPIIFNYLMKADNYKLKIKKNN